MTDSDWGYHVFHPTRDDHTQYARTDGTRTVSSLTATGTVKGSTVTATLTGTNGRYVGATNGAPATGTYLTDDFANDPTNQCFWICTAGGTPGTWHQVGGVLTKAGTTTVTTDASGVATISFTAAFPNSIKAAYAQIWGGSGGSWVASINTLTTSSFQFVAITAAGTPKANSSLGIVWIAVGT